MYRIIGSDGQQYGPVSAEQIRQWMTEGRVDARTLAQSADSAQWLPIGSIPEFAPAAGAPATGTPSASPTLHAAPFPRVSAGEISAYLAQAILCTVFCCLPFGIVAIVYAAQVNSKLAAGDYEGARESSKNAKMWCWISFGLGLGSFIIGFLMMLLGAIVDGF